MITEDLGCYHDQNPPRSCFALGPSAEERSECGGWCGCGVMAVDSHVGDADYDLTVAGGGVHRVFGIRVPLPAVDHAGRYELQGAEEAREFFHRMVVDPR